MTIKKAKAIEKLLATIDIDVSSDEIKEFDTLSELEEYLDENGSFDVEVIYYGKAMEYLMEHDTSLTDSMALAHDMGYQVNEINSELLATLLATEKTREDFHNIEDEIEEILE